MYLNDIQNPVQGNGLFHLASQILIFKINKPMLSFYWHLQNDKTAL